MKTIHILLTVIVVLALAGCAARSPVAERGDTVLVNYIGKFQNGTVFDTNIPFEAQNAGLYNPKRTYEPLNVTIGQSKVISGFENALVGMKAGDTKTVVISPDQGYGPHSEGMVADIPIVSSALLVVAVNRRIAVPMEVLLNKNPDARAGSTITEENVTYYVERIGLENATLVRQTEPGEKIVLPQTTWTSTVLNVTNDSIILRQDIKDGQHVQTTFGPANATVKDGIVTLLLTLEPGGIWKNPQFGTGIVKSINGTDAVIDFNHPLAGKTLVFDLMAVSVEKANTTG